MGSISGNIFSETLQEITNTKLEELSKSRAHFEDNKAKLISRIKLVENDPIKRLNILSDGVKHCLGIKTDKTSGSVLRGQTENPALEIELKNLDSLLTQARYDPSVSTKSFDMWESSLLHHLDTQSLKYEYASLYAGLVTEWLSAEKTEPPKSSAACEPRREPAEDQEAISTKARDAARLEWERVVFQPAKVDEDKLGSFLDELFRDKDNTNTKKIALRTLKELITNFENSFQSPHQFTESNLKTVIQGLLASDLLPDKKREVLKSFKDSPIILAEIADVLNMRIAALDNWSWGNFVPVEETRKINGVYSIRMNEDLLQAIFLQYIGLRWSVFFKGALKGLRRFGGPWKDVRADIPKIDKKRLGYYLGSYSTSPSVQHLRRRYVMLFPKHHVMRAYELTRFQSSS